MNIRTASADDQRGVRETVERSLEASYALSPQDIETILESQFAEEAFDERVDADGERYVAELDDDPDDAVEPVGFAEVDADGALRWLHVHPNARGRGVGSGLCERVRSDLESTGTPFTARVLESAREGERFLERFGLGPTGTGTWDCDGQEFAEQIYTTEGSEGGANEPTVTVPESAELDGESRPLDESEEIPGSAAPFYPVYEDRGERAGYFCSECGSTAVAMDGMDRLECSECGNVHRPDEWDAAYL